MYEIKTLKSTTNPEDLIAKFEDDRKEKCLQLVRIFKKITGLTPTVWGKDVFVGFGQYSYASKNCRGTWFTVGFANRKQNIVLYLGLNVDLEQLIEKYHLKGWKAARSCLYLPSKGELDYENLEKLITQVYPLAINSIQNSSLFKATDMIT